jgi:hypothetical protein
MKSGWIVEKNNGLQGLGLCNGKMKWMHFSDERITLHESKEAAEAVIAEHKLADVATALEHMWV